VKKIAAFCIGGCGSKWRSQRRRRQKNNHSTKILLKEMEDQKGGFRNEKE
jgi:hypothetical protein